MQESIETFVLGRCMALAQINQTQPVYDEMRDFISDSLPILMKEASVHKIGRRRNFGKYEKVAVYLFGKLCRLDRNEGNRKVVNECMSQIGFDGYEPGSKRFRQCIENLVSRKEKDVIRVGEYISTLVPKRKKAANGHSLKEAETSSMMEPNPQVQQADNKECMIQTGVISDSFPRLPFEDMETQFKNDIEPCFQWSPVTHPDDNTSIPPNPNSPYSPFESDYVQRTPASFLHATAQTDDPSLEMSDDDLSRDDNTLNDWSVDSDCQKNDTEEWKCMAYDFKEMCNGH